MRPSIGRLSFFWWGTFWRGWCQRPQWINICADKDYNVTARGFIFGPFEVGWWSRRDWRAYCFTPEEAAADDAKYERLAASAGEKHD